MLRQCATVCTMSTCIVLYLFVFVARFWATSVDEGICFSGSLSLCFIAMILLFYCFFLSVFCTVGKQIGLAWMYKTKQRRDYLFMTVRKLLVEECHNRAPGAGWSRRLQARKPWRTQQYHSSNEKRQRRAVLEHVRQLSHEHRMKE